MGSLVGTVEFMSPEQISNAEDVNFTADLWALGVLAYMMLLAARPFDGDKTTEVLMAVRLGQYEPPSRVLPGLPPGLDSWFARAFCINFKKRFPSAPAAAEAWRAALAAPASSAQGLDSTVVSAGVSAPGAASAANVEEEGPVSTFASRADRPSGRGMGGPPSNPQVTPHPLDVTAVSAGIATPGPPASTGPSSLGTPAPAAGPMSGALVGPTDGGSPPAAASGPSLVIIAAIGVAVIFVAAVVIVLVAAC
jgi:serine/threonine-protein kinase